MRRLNSYAHLALREPTPPLHQPPQISGEYIPIVEMSLLAKVPAMSLDWGRTLMIVEKLQTDLDDLKGQLAKLAETLALPQWSREQDNLDELLGQLLQYDLPDAEGLCNQLHSIALNNLPNGPPVRSHNK